MSKTNGTGPTRPTPPKPKPPSGKALTRGVKVRKARQRDPEKEFTSIFIVEMQGFGKKEHQAKLARRVIRELEVAFHARGKVKVHKAALTVNTVTGLKSYKKGEQVFRDDSNATVE